MGSRTAASTTSPSWPTWFGAGDRRISGMDPVTEALLGRLQPDGGIQRMMGLSLAAHVVALAALVLMASVWRGAQTVTREVMTISLGGSAGPASWGPAP